MCGGRIVQKFTAAQHQANVESVPVIRRFIALYFSIFDRENFSVCAAEHKVYNAKAGRPIPRGRSCQF